MKTFISTSEIYNDQFSKEEQEWNITTSKNVPSAFYSFDFKMKHLIVPIT
jgi:hypothetical protein